MFSTTYNDVKYIVLECLSVFPYECMAVGSYDDAAANEKFFIYVLNSNLMPFMCGWHFIDCVSKE